MIKITQKQAPQFRALIKAKDTDDLFDASLDLATAADLTTEGINKAPITYTIYKSTNEIAPYVSSTESAIPVEGYEDVELTSDAFIAPSDVEEAGLDYNFCFTPANRATFAFPDVGNYFVDVLIYPKTGAAIVFRVPVQVA